MPRNEKSHWVAQFLSQGTCCIRGRFSMTFLGTFLVATVLVESVWCIVYCLQMRGIETVRSTLFLALYQEFGMLRKLGWKGVIKGCYLLGLVTVKIL